ncbi:MAG TPA: hypothetical protein VHG91_18555 [Longimicrobium sp.]|nr:hypothetical protein [Longimicrobium sp.]
MSAQTPETYATARDVNPSAGDHVVTADPTERGAGERATRRSWRRFPYYAARYDGRGRRFGVSDSLWLVTLCDLLPGAAREQVRWLGSVLAARGMPRWMLEVHIDYLHDELARALPAQAARYAVLAACARDLREQREAHVAPDVFDAIAAAFDEKTAALPRRVRAFGGLLVAAVADERAGVGNAVESLERWATAPECFPEEWIRAVRETIAEARARAR